MLFDFKRIFCVPAESFLDSVDDFLTDHVERHFDEVSTKFLNLKEDSVRLDALFDDYNSLIDSGYAGRNLVYSLNDLYIQCFCLLFLDDLKKLHFSYLTRGEKGSILLHY